MYENRRTGKNKTTLIAPKSSKFQVNPNCIIENQFNNGDTALIIAVRNDDLQLAEKLVANGNDVNASNLNCETPLHIASMGAGNYGFAQFLIDKGAFVNQRNCIGATPAHYAAYYGLYSIVKLLLDNGCEINARDNKGETVLHKAAYYGWVEIWDFLIDKGANVDIYNNIGETPLAKARKLDFYCLQTPQKNSTGDQESNNMNTSDRKELVSRLIKSDEDELVTSALQYIEFIKEFKEEII